MSELARKYVLWGVAGGVLQFALIAMIAFSGSDEPSIRSAGTAPGESKTSVQASAAHATGRTRQPARSARRPTRQVSLHATSEPDSSTDETASTASSEDEAPSTPDAAGTPVDAGGGAEEPGPAAASPPEGSDGPVGETPADLPPAEPSPPPGVDSADEPQPAPEAAAPAPPSSLAVSAELGPAGIEHLIRDVFGDQGDKAVEVARCESELNPKAQRGQFLGLFQMGAHERADYGHSTDPLKQIQAAYRLFRERGWQPWTCA